MTQAELAEALAGRLPISVDQTIVSKWELGKREPDLATIAAIERATGRPPGWILVAAGLVDLPTDTRSAIEADAALTPQARTMLLASYEAALSTSARTRPTTPPT